MKTQAKNYSSTIKSVDKALTLLETFSELEEGINLTRLSEKLGMNKSGVHRLLQVFKQRGYVEQLRRNGKYQLGLSAFRVSQNIVSNNQLLKIAKPFMESLVNDCNETVYLVLNCDDHVLFFDHVDSTNAVNVTSLKGRCYPLDKSSAGLVQKVLCADPSKVVEGHLDEEDEVCSQVRSLGYCADQNQLGAGVASISVPLFGVGNKVVGSLCVVGPEFRLTPHKIKTQLLAPLLRAGRIVSIKIGADAKDINLSASKGDY